MKKQLIIAYNGKSVSVLVAEPRLTADQLGQHSSDSQIFAVRRSYGYA